MTAPRPAFSDRSLREPDARRPWFTWSFASLLGFVACLGAWGCGDEGGGGDGRADAAVPDGGNTIDAGGTPDGGTDSGSQTCTGLVDAAVVDTAGLGDVDGGIDGVADRPRVSIDDYPAVDGSTSTLPLARVVACDLLGLDYAWQAGIGDEGTALIVPIADTPEEQIVADGVIEKIVHNKTHDAYLNLIDGVADVILVANLPSPDEVDYACSRGVALDARPIAQDALVIVVNANNPVEGLSTDQVRKIFLGEITMWSEVGGTPGWYIEPFARPENSGSQQLFNAIVLGGDMSVTLPPWPVERRPAFMGVLLDRVQEIQQAIGYSVYYYVTFQRPDDRFKTLAIDGVAPSAESIADGSYPFAAPVWSVVRADLDPRSSAAQLRDWLLTPDGQVTVSHSGYAPLRTDR